MDHDYLRDVTRVMMSTIVSAIPYVIASAMGSALGEQKWTTPREHRHTNYERGYGSVRNLVVQMLAGLSKERLESIGPVELVDPVTAQRLD